MNVVCCQVEVLWDELITRPEKSYWLWCVVVCDIETSWMRRPWPTGGCRAKNKQTNFTICTPRQLWLSDQMKDEEGRINVACIGTPNFGGRIWNEERAGKLRRRMKDKIKMNPKEEGLETEVRVHLVSETDHWSFAVNRKNTTLFLRHYLHNRTNSDRVCWVISMYINLRNVLSKHCRFPLKHPV
jgi:hypothetical protein